MKNCSSTFKILNEDVDLMHVSITIHVIDKNVIKASSLRDLRLNQIVDRIMHTQFGLGSSQNMFVLADEEAPNHQYCEQKLQNVNPTDTEDPKDTKNKVVTARDRLEDDNTKAKLPRNDIMLHMAKP